MDDEKRLKREELKAQLAALDGSRPAISAGNDVENSTLTVGDYNLIAHEGAQVINISGSTITIGSPSVDMPAMDRTSVRGRYIEHIIAQNRYLELQGIRSGGRLISVELEKIYIALRANWNWAENEQDAWLVNQAAMAPGEQRKTRAVVQMQDSQTTSDSSDINVETALARQKHLVVLGDPGSGKTTLLRYLAMVYARDVAENSQFVKTRLGLDESGYLPVFMPLRQVGAYLQAQPNDGTEGHIVLLKFLLKLLQNENVDLPVNFFEDDLKNGRAVVLLDGLDEVSDPSLRGRVAQLVLNFTRAYPLSRFVVTSRIVGYIETVRLGDAFAETTIRDFRLEDIRAFLTRWHQAVAVSQMGPNQSAMEAAAAQTNQLADAIQANERILDLAINPLMLTVIALIHRDQVKLPDRRSELYAEAVDVLLGKRDEARGIREQAILEDRPFDTGDRRLLLQYVAFWMHEQGRKEIGQDDLHKLLIDYMKQRCSGDEVERAAAARRAAQRFLNSITERSGLIQARGEGIYAFSHLTFQEYLAAVALADRDDFIEYSLLRAENDWWREVLLLEAGHLAKNGPGRVTNLVRSISLSRKETELFHNLVLAAECIRDVGEVRLAGGLANEIRTRMQTVLENPGAGRIDRQLMEFLRPKEKGRDLIQRRIAVATAFGRIGGVEYWHGLYGEPDWAAIPAGPFWMGSEQGDENEKPLHQVNLLAYAIARTPITCTQYEKFIQASGYAAPQGWEGTRAPRGRELHPVVSVTWFDARAYCEWLSMATHQRICLPSEAQWEKAARWDNDQRIYPWGNREPDKSRCNIERWFEGPTPVGVFKEGASPYGVLDMVGNVWEWCADWYEENYYRISPPRNPPGPDKGNYRIGRGGSWVNILRLARCSCRGWIVPDFYSNYFGFRPVLSLVDSGS